MYFSCLDLSSGFFQIPLHKDSVKKTAFSTPFGLFAWKRMPQGLTSSPATFQRAMAACLSGLTGTQACVYLDDIIVMGKDFGSHLESLREVFKRLKTDGFSLKLKKCHFFQEEATYLGHVVNRLGRKPLKKNVEAVRDFPVPHGTEKQKIQQTQAFIGLANYYAAYIKDFESKRESLVRLTKKGVCFVWGEQQQEAFDQLKLDLTSYPLLRHPDFDRPFILETDASFSGIGGCLSQEFSDGVHPILYISRSLKQAERKWPVRELEALAVVWCIKKLRFYLEGNKFVVKTDHHSLKWMFDAEVPSRIARWALSLQEFLPQMTIEYRKGTENSNADFLSRFPVLASLGVCSVDGAISFLQARKTVLEKFEQLGRKVQLQESQLAARTPENTVGVSSVVLNDEDKAVFSDEEEMSEETEAWDGLGDSPGEQEEQKVADLGDKGFLDLVRMGYQNDRKWSGLLEFLERPDSPTLTQLEKDQMIYRSEHFLLRDGLLYLRGFFRHNTRDARVPLERLVIPDSLRVWVISQLHDSVSACHVGRNRVVNAEKRRFYFPHMDRVIENYVRTCARCQKAKATKDRRAGLLQTKGVSEPGCLGIDLQGPFPRSKGRFDTILTMKDCFVGNVVLVPLDAAAGKNQCEKYSGRDGGKMDSILWFT